MTYNEIRDSSLISYSLHRLRCPSARKYRQLQKKLPLLLNFFSFVTIFLIQTSIIKTFKNMTTISTSSENLFSKIQKYLKNNRVGFTSSLSNEAYALTIFDLSDSETTTLIQKMTKHFHLTPRQQEPLALAA